MSRPLRIEYADCWYHVMNRGAGYQEIYQSPQHYQLFIETLSEALELYGIECHGYSLMPNHYHLLLKTPRGNLSRAMRHINGKYTQRYNRLTKRDGPLFRGRYKAIIVDEDSYLLQVSRYIHLNPVVANIIEKAEEYEWSSYKYYVGSHPAPDWLHTSFILKALDESGERAAYNAFVAKGVDEGTEEFYKKTKQPIIFGASDFKERLLSKVNKENKQACATDYGNTKYVPEIDKICHACCSFFGVRATDLLKVRRGYANLPRKIAIYACRVWGCATNKDIAKKFKFNSLSVVSDTVNKVEQELAKNIKLKQKIMVLKEETLVTRQTNT